MNSDNLVITLGCRLNYWESDKINSILVKNKKKNILVLNTCSVTNEAVKNSVKKIRSLSKKFPSSKIVVTGCAVETDLALFKSLPEVSGIVRNKDKLSLEKWKHIDVKGQSQLCLDFEKTKLKVNPSNSNVRKFIKIQSGCNHSCTFCIIPTCRGNSISEETSNINKDISGYIEKGVKEVILTGVDITSWGEDFNLPLTLGDLVEDIFRNNKNLKRLRLSSIDVAEFDDKFIYLLKNEKRLMPHFHFSLQSLDDMILKRMKRRHDVSRVIRLFEKIREAAPYVTFGADFITGFPTETNEMFLNTLELVKKLKISHLHVFPYSAKIGTPASKMPQVPVEIRRERSKTLRRLGQENFLEILNKFLQKKHEVLIEDDSGNGKTENNLPVKVSTSNKGNIIKFIPKKIDRDRLLLY